MKTPIRLSAAILATMLAAAPLTLASSAEAYFRDPGTYRVVDIAGADSLNLRAGPNRTARVIATIPFDARGLVATGRSFLGWIEVRYTFGDEHLSEIRGWVHRDTVASDDGVSETRFHVVDLAPGERLDIRRRPYDGSRRVGTIPAYAEHIVSRRDCADGWCAIRYSCETGPMEGFVRQDNLAVERSPNRYLGADNGTGDDYGSGTTTTDNGSVSDAGDSSPYDSAYERRLRWRKFWHDLLHPRDRYSETSYN